ncbi:hypothetical protein BSZ19_18305 [Bradyrhizobium japonicum]|uniref:DUF7482 domain-containing protein n=2 Tax=Bradyrhizobium japonicum TaxID=375 RepID=A0A1Y2JS44_BRAJP|nr:hypothetical protein BSZ19_18305 [Bradyrhizobium japonicum]
MRSNKPVGKCNYRPAIVLLLSFFVTEGSAAADTSTEKRITKLFLTSGQVDLAREVVRLPLHRGRLSSGETVWFVLTDVSDFATSKKMGLTWAPSLSKAKDVASTRVAEMDESDNFIFKSGRVDFSPVQTLKAGESPNFYPPRSARAGSVGDAHYSPLVRVTNRNDIVFNAPMIAFNVGPEKISFCGGNPNYSVVLDSVASICPDNGTVDLKLRFGFADGRHLRYLSFDANSEESAVLEASTFAPAESDILQSGATEIIYTIVNGRTGPKDPERQGLNSALNGEGPSLDILAHFKEISAGYSPMWDVQLAQWSKETIEKNQRRLITDGDDITAKSQAGVLVSPIGGPVRTTQNLVNCPVVGFTNE